MKVLSIIIPLYNEEGTIISILEEILQIGKELKSKDIGLEVIISNDGSTDNSANKVKEFIANKPEFVFIDNEVNCGKGFAVKQGISNSKGDYIIIQDADLEYTPADYICLIKELERKELDFIYGSRILGIKKYGNTYSTFSFLLGGLLVSFITSFLSCTKVTDEPTCYKMFRGNLKSLLICPKENGFEWEPAITMLLFRNGYKYGEYPIHYKARKPEEGKKIKWIDGLKAIITLFKRRFKKINCK